VPYSFGGGLALNRPRYFRFRDEQMELARAAPRLASITCPPTRGFDPGTYEYLAPVLRVDLDLAVHVTKSASLFINGSQHRPRRERRVQRYGDATPALASRTVSGRLTSRFGPSGVKMKF
jgi:hypothetical protein